MVRVPAVLKVKLDKMRVPATNVRWPAVAPLSSAMAALLSELLMVTLGVALDTTFQLASTALTTRRLAMAEPAVWAIGEPVLPLEVPGAASSPGKRSCNFVGEPGLTVTAEPVFAVIPA